MYGLLALSFFVAAILAGMLVFQVVKAAFRLPTLLNWPGAICVGAAVIQLTGWLSHDLFAGLMLGPTPPDVPWYQWLEFLLFAVVWYAATISLLLMWRKGDDGERGAAQ
ncbi:hypothetical protein RHDC4_00348 [Rhodocyclaceae bacterium]|nr:hypothetical protein RHDC4_00348 [Rhodocyclaceae bacterium]